MAHFGHDIVVIGASAGGVSALKKLVSLLPQDLPASLFVVLHVPADSRSLLPQILAGAGSLQVASARNGEKIKHGKVYIAPPDHHMLLTRGEVRLTRGPKENRHRPAIDPLFRSAAWAYGPRTVGIVLSGTLDDGTAGLRAIKSCRGTTLVQDPVEAQYPGMPENAILHAPVDYCATIEKLAAAIIELAAKAVHDPDSYEVADHIKIETEFAFMERDMRDMKSLGSPAGIVCPTCHGSLTEMQDGEMVRYRCHTGHAFSQESLVAEQDEDVENALYAAVRAIDENLAVSRRIAKTYGGRFPVQKAEHEGKAESLEKSAAVLRKLIIGRNGRNLREPAGET